MSAGLLLTGCGGAGESPPPDTADGVQVAMVTELAPDDAAAVGDAVNRFGFDLLGEVTDGNENAVTSPLSAAATLAMVLAGAGGDTAAEMADVLHLEDSRDARVGALLERLVDTDDVTLSTANALWAQDGYPFNSHYFEFVQDTFDATLDTTDLAAPEIVDTVDSWVDEHTEGRITEMAADLGLPNDDAVLVLMNAVYFLGEWTTQFDPDLTIDAPFTLTSGEQAQVPTMHLRELPWQYAERDGYRMLRLPYGEDGRYGMEILLPDAGVGLDRLLSDVDAAEWRAAVGALTEQTVSDLALPRFELRWEAELNEPLQALGMVKAFLDADFTPMSPRNPYLAIVVQKTFLRVDEAGTEAAAATGAVMEETAMPEPLTFAVDRPFAFTISDTETGAILFLGAVADPRG